MPSDLDKQLILQPTHDIGITLELYDSSFTKLDEIQGRMRSMNANISSTSDIRRTCSLVLGIIDGSFSSESFEVTWLDRLVKVSIGLLNGASYVWYSIGFFLLDTDSYSYDATTNDLSLSLMDMMAAATDARGSQIGSSLLIPYGSNVRNSLIATVARFSPFVQYDVAELPDVVPFDQEFEPGSYAHAILKKLVDLFPYYEMYYSPTGVFTVKKIPTHIDEPLFVDKSFMDEIIIKENRTGKLGNIKNSTEIWGAELDSTYAAASTTTTNGTYDQMQYTTPIIDADAILSFDGIDSEGFSMVDGVLYYTGDDIYTISDGELFVEDTSSYHDSVYNLVHTPPITVLEAGADYFFVPNSTLGVDQFIKVDSLTSVPLLNSDGTALEIGALQAGRAYVMRYSPILVNEVVAPRFLLQGEWQIHVIVKEVNVMPGSTYIASDKLGNDCNDIEYIVNPDSPYACDRGTLDYDDGEIRQVFYGGDYGLIYTTELALQRAAYETWLKTRLQTDAEIECLLVPWMDVNVKIEYTSPVTGIARQYIVKEVSMNPSEFTMTLSLSRFYPYDPFI